MSSANPPTLAASGTFTATAAGSAPRWRHCRWDDVWRPRRGRAADGQSEPQEDYLEHGAASPSDAPGRVATGWVIGCVSLIRADDLCRRRLNQWRQMPAHPKESFLPP